MECFTCLTDTAHLLDCYINTDLCFHLLSLCSDFRSSSSPLNYPQTMNLQTDNISILYLSRHYLSKLDCVEISLIKEVTSDFSHICVVSCHLSKSSFHGSSCPQGSSLLGQAAKHPPYLGRLGADSPWSLSHYLMFLQQFMVLPAGNVNYWLSPGGKIN